MTVSDTWAWGVAKLAVNRSGIWPLDRSAIWPPLAGLDADEECFAGGLDDLLGDGCFPPADRAT